MHNYVVALFVLAGSLGALAADPSEAGVPTSPLKIYSWGLSGGAAIAVSDQLKNQAARFFKLSFVNSVYLKENISLFADADWFAPGKNFGADVGIDLLPAMKDFVAFCGVGVGAHYFDREHETFGRCVGPSATAHLGFLMNVTDAVQVRFRVPFHVTVNEWNDQTIGVDLGFLISDPLKKVKKLNY